MSRLSQWVPPLNRSDLHAVVALLYTAIVLTLLEYPFRPGNVQQRLAPGSSGLSLEAGAEWALACVCLYLVIPVLLMVCVHRRSPLAFGFSTRGLLRHLRIYLACFAVMLPLIIWVRGENPRFEQTYPFVKAASTDPRVFLRWEVVYLAQFIALEAFFRGYLLFALERSVGGLAVFIMTVPYCMIHYHKPLPETFGAIIAGVFLGTLALRYRSWAGGALLHMLVALTMDALAAHERGLFGLLEDG